MIDRRNKPMELLPTETRLARFSDCEKYRYLLKITWDEDKPALQCVGLNPSTANEERNDPTVAKLIRMSKVWGYGTLLMTNLFAYRATDPGEMIYHNDPVGPENDEQLWMASEHASIILCAWGTFGDHRNRDLEVLKVLAPRRNLHYLQMTKNGFPSHPLYLKESLTPVHWPEPVGGRR